ncbi:hypothetical protein [Pendulispora albinea]|uniref:Uncharacterized protein n=1 Tax=Pendulispora albinea TaxID=2741071 RepID=A0ABZ2LJI3_9BACT
MKKQFLFSLAAASFLALGMAAVGCSDDNPSGPGGPGGPGPRDSGTIDSGNKPDGGSDNDGGACSNKPAGCFCGKPTTQAQWLNRCTSSVALPFTKTFRAAAATDLP